MTTSPTRMDAPTRREQILKEAARLFAERGFHGVGVDEIGAAVGISERLLDGGRLRVGETTGDPEALLGALIDGHIDFALDDRPLITLHDRELDRLKDEDRKRVRQLQRQYVELWVAVVRELYPAAGESEVRAAVHAVFGLLNSTPHSIRPGTAKSAGQGTNPGSRAILREMTIAALSSAGRSGG